MQGSVMGRVTINGTQSQFSCKKSIPLDVAEGCRAEGALQRQDSP